MSLNQKEIGQLISIVRGLVIDVDKAVAVSGGGANGTLLFADLVAVGTVNLTRNQIAALEQPGLGTPAAFP